MPRLAARDTEPQRQVKIMDAVSRRLDELREVDPHALARVLTWVDGLIDETNAAKELHAMKAIADQLVDAPAKTREVVVRWLFENYGDETGREDDEQNQ